MERIAYAILLTFAVGWLVIMLAGMIATWPWGIVGLLLIGALGLLFTKVLIERLKNREDDHYARNVDK